MAPPFRTANINLKSEYANSLIKKMPKYCNFPLRECLNRILAKKKKGAITDTLLYFKPHYLLFGLAAPVAFLAAFGAAFLALAFVAIFQMYLAPAIGVGLSP